MNRFVSVLTALFITFFCIIPAWAVNYPSRPTGFVNDYAGVLNRGQKSNLETRLQRYEKQTGVEIAIVIPASLEDSDIEQWTTGLFEKENWQVGKKGIDNGLMIVIAPNERKCRIEVGYGLEGEITDMTASHIIQSKIIPYVKKQDYYGALDSALGAVEEKLGNYTAEQLTEKALARAEELERQKAKQKEAFDFIFLLFFILLVAAAFCYGVYRIVKFIKKQLEKMKLRKFLRGEIDKISKEVDGLQDRIEQAASRKANIPEWAVREISEKSSVGLKTAAWIKSNCDSIKITLNSDVYGAKEAYNRILNDVDGVNATINKIENVYSDIEKVKKDAREKVVQLGKSLELAEINTNNAKSNGISVEKSVKTLLAIKEKIGLIRSRFQKNGIGKTDESLEIAAECSALLEQLSKFNEYTASLKDQKSKIEQYKAGFEARMAGFYEIVKSGQAVLDEVKKNNPENVWLSVSDNFSKIPSMITSIEKGIDALRIVRLDSEDAIEEAFDLKNSIDFDLEKVDTYLLSLKNLSIKIETAQKSVKKLLKDMDNSIKEAENTGKDSDIENNTKIAIESAIKKYKAEKKKAEQPMVDWISVDAALKKISTALEESVKVAKEEIKKAKKRRQSSSSGSVYGAATTVRTSSSSNNGFGGFSGGKSGGGGASGSW